MRAGWNWQTTLTRQNPSPGAIEEDGDVIDVFEISSRDTHTHTNRWEGLLRNRERAVIRAHHVGVELGESVQFRYTITSVLDEEDFNGANVLGGLKEEEGGGSKRDKFLQFL